MVSLAQKMLKRSSNTNDNGNDKCIGHNDLVPDKQGYDTYTTNDTISCLPKAYWWIVISNADTNQNIGIANIVANIPVYDLQKAQLKRHGNDNNDS